MGEPSQSLGCHPVALSPLPLAFLCVLRVSALNSVPKNPTKFTLIVLIAEPARGGAEPHGEGAGGGLGKGGVSWQEASRPSGGPGKRRAHFSFCISHFSFCISPKPSAILQSPEPSTP